MWLEFADWPHCRADPAICRDVGRHVPITGCTQTGIFTLANLCGSIGSAPPYGFVLTQSSRNVSGTFTLGSLAFGSTGGTVDANGSLGLSSTHTESGVTIVATWALNMPASAIAGTLTQVWTSNGSAGQATVVGTISTAGRTAAFVPRTRQAPRSVQDLIEAVSQP